MPTNKHSFWLAVVIGLSPCFLLAEERDVSFPEVGIELPKPEGFIVSKEWQGLEHEATGSRVQIKPSRRHSPK